MLRAIPAAKKKNESDGSKVLRYWKASPTKELEGAVTECALFAGLGVDFVKDLLRGSELVERLWQECETAHRTG
jgi:hypothetical protein